MAHVEPDGLPVDTLAPALCDALTDVSTELVDGQHAAHGSLYSVGFYGSTVRVTVVVRMGRGVSPDTRDAVTGAWAALAKAGDDAMRALARPTGGTR